MNQCPITYEDCGEAQYSQKGLKLLDRRLKNLQNFPYSQEEQFELASQAATKLSIQGVQPKFSVRLNVAKQRFELVDAGGTYIVKPKHFIYKELPENEDLTMKLAAMIGIEVPVHGLVYCKDGSFSYFIKRFDRLAHGNKLAVEDFAQLCGDSRETKYNSSMERVAKVIERFCTFPVAEKAKLFNLTLFSFLVGNEDLHIKNLAIIRKKGRIELSPAFDLLNSSILLDSKEELALPLNGKKSRLNAFDFFEYYAIEKLQLAPKILEEIIQRYQSIMPTWKELIHKSFLSDSMKISYWNLVQERYQRLWPIEKSR